LHGDASALLPNLVGDHAWRHFVRDPVAALIGVR